jgi:hypothetical protein
MSHHEAVPRGYDADNHLFFPGTNQSTPADYDPPQHVDPAVIDDIARWLAPRQGFLARLRLRQEPDKNQNCLPAAPSRRHKAPRVPREYAQFSPPSPATVQARPRPLGNQWSRR